jgi:hypothetical protein
MPLISIDPIENYYRVATSLVGRVMLFFAAGWCGVFLGRLTVAFHSFRDLLDPGQIITEIFGSGYGVIGEVLAMVFWPVATAGSAGEVSVWLFLFSMLILAVVFAVFVYSEEPAPAWWLGLVGFSATIHVIGSDDATAVSWLILIVVLAGLGSAFWWSLLVWHPELCESVGDLFRGRSSRPGYSQIRKKAPPGAWPEPVDGWESPPRRGPRGD